MQSRILKEAWRWCNVAAAQYLRFPRVCCPMREVKCGRRHLAAIDMSLSNMNQGMAIRHHHICRATGRPQL